MFFKGFNLNFQNKKHFSSATKASETVKMPTLYHFILHSLPLTHNPPLFPFCPCVLNWSLLGHKLKLNGQNRRKNLSLALVNLQMYNPPRIPKRGGPCTPSLMSVIRTVLVWVPILGAMKNPGMIYAGSRNCEGNTQLCSHPSHSTSTFSGLRTHHTARSSQNW